MTVKSNTPVSTAVLLSVLLVVTGCGGSARKIPPGELTSAQAVNQPGFYLQQEVPEATQTMLAPVCPTTVPSNKTGWSLHAGDWCVITCDTPGTAAPQWRGRPGEARCLAHRDEATGHRVEAPFTWSDLTLKTTIDFHRFSRSFLKDTEWHCKEYRYDMDPETRRGVWKAVIHTERLYQFHRNAQLMIGFDARNLWPSGSWAVRNYGRLYFDQRHVFRYVVRDSGNRFDVFTNARQKQICRFYGEVPGAIPNRDI